MLAHLRSSQPFSVPPRWPQGPGQASFISQSSLSSSSARAKSKKINLTKACPCSKPAMAPHYP